MDKDMRYVVSVDQLGKKRKYVYASSSLDKCRDYVQRKHRGCRLMTRKTDAENDVHLVEKYVQIFNRTLHEKIIIIIRIRICVLDEEIKEVNENDRDRRVP